MTFAKHVIESGARGECFRSAEAGGGGAARDVGLCWGAGGCPGVGGTGTAPERVQVSGRAQLAVVESSISFCCSPEAEVASLEVGSYPCSSPFALSPRSKGELSVPDPLVQSPHRGDTAWGTGWPG